jgi:hypothetical protein
MSAVLVRKCSWVTWLPAQFDSLTAAIVAGPRSARWNRSCEERRPDSSAGRGQGPGEQEHRGPDRGGGGGRAFTASFLSVHLQRDAAARSAADARAQAAMAPSPHLIADLRVQLREALEESAAGRATAAASRRAVMARVLKALVGGDLRRAWTKWQRVCVSERATTKLGAITGRSREAEGEGEGA